MGDVILGKEKIIFLDIDGVLNIHSPSYFTSSYERGNMKYMEEHLIKRLEWLLKKTEAKIVISSSWKSDMDDLIEQLKKNGFTMEERIIDRTPFLSHRGEEIYSWLVEFGVFTKNFVVFDDEIADICGDKCSMIDPDNVVEVDFSIGLTHDNVVKAKEILEYEPLLGD